MTPKGPLAGSVEHAALDLVCLSSKLGVEITYGEK